MNDNTRIELEALITEREGMVTAVASCLDIEPMPYTEDDFFKLADKIRVLSEPHHKPGEVVPVKDIKNFLQCSICNGISENKGKKLNDVCGAQRSKGHGVYFCLGILRKG